MGSAILSLSLGGQHHSPQALAAGDWLLAHPFLGYGEQERGSRPIFLQHTAIIAAKRRRNWADITGLGIFPPIARVLLEIQLPDGSFPIETRTDGIFGPVYSSAMAVLSLTPAYQILPVYQR